MKIESNSELDANGDGEPQAEGGQSDQKSHDSFDDIEHISESYVFPSDTSGSVDSFTKRQAEARGKSDTMRTKDSELEMLEAGRPLRYSWMKICCFKGGCLQKKLLSYKYLELALRQLEIERSSLDKIKA